MGETSIDDQSILGALKSPPSQMLPLVLCVNRSRDRFRLSTCSRVRRSRMNQCEGAQCVQWTKLDNIYSGIADLESPSAYL